MEQVTKEIRINEIKNWIKKNGSKRLNKLLIEELFDINIIAYFYVQERIEKEFNGWRIFEQEDYEKKYGKIEVLTKDIYNSDDCFLNKIIETKQNKEFSDVAIYYIEGQYTFLIVTCFEILPRLRIFWEYTSD